MLVALLKTIPQVKAKILKFEDRIWITDNGNANVLRRFWIQIEQDSPPLNMLRCFLSRKPVDSVEDLTDEFGDSRKYYFNERQRFTGLVDIVKGREQNLIDGIWYRKCKLTSKDISVVEVGEGISLDFDLNETPLEPNSVYLLSTKFTVRRFVDMKLLEDIEETYFSLDYCCHVDVPDMYACIETDMAIPIVPLLPAEEGGFFVAVYSPPRYQIIPIDKDIMETQCDHDYRGNSIPLVSGCFWELSDFMKKQSRDPITNLVAFLKGKFTCGMRVKGKMVQRVYATEVKRGIERMNKLTWIAIGISAAALIASIVAIVLVLG